MNSHRYRTRERKKKEKEERKNLIIEKKKERFKSGGGSSRANLCLLNRITAESGINFRVKFVQDFRD